MRGGIPTWLIAALAFAISAGPASAYIGPGMGAGALAVALGMIAAVLMAVAALVWYPVKRLIRARNSANGDRTRSPPQEGADR